MFEIFKEVVQTVSLVSFIDQTSHQ